MGLLVRAFFFLVVGALAALSAWVGSSLASWLGGPRWLAIGCALLLLPGLALAWERGAVQRRLRLKARRRVSLPATVAMRAVVLAGVFLGLLLAWWPNQTFLALAQRGDWFLDGAPPSWAFLRPWTHAGAEALEGLWRKTIPDPYRKWRTEPPRLAEAPRPAAIARAVPLPSELPGETGGAERFRRWRPLEGGPSAAAFDAGSPRRLCAQLDDGAQVCVEEEEPPAAPEPEPAREPPPGPGEREPLPAQVVQPRQPSPAGGAARPDWTWPLPPQHHPVLAELSAREEASIDSLGRALARGSSPGADRLKAVHDWVADRVAYDATAYQRSQFPGQTAEEVLARRTAVCAGYSRLFEALATAAGEKVVTLSGQANGMNGFEAHAWSAAQLGSGWVLIDVTWDSGFVRRTEPDWTTVKAYRADWLFMPPELFADTHLPNDAQWQLLERPRSAADVLSRPRLRPAFAGTGLSLRRPTGALTEVSLGRYQVELENPLKRSVLAQACLGPRCASCEGGGPGADRLGCPLDAAGTWDLRLFAAPPGQQQHEVVAEARLQVRN